MSADAELLLGLGSCSPPSLGSPISSMASPAAANPPSSLPRAPLKTSTPPHSVSPPTLPPPKPTLLTLLSSLSSSAPSLPPPFPPNEFATETPLSISPDAPADFPEPRPTSLLADKLQAYPPLPRPRSASMSALPDAAPPPPAPSMESISEEEAEDVPDMMQRFSAIYNKGGRIGIYTREERSRILERFLLKRSNRNWKKKIRYGCRKSLADRRTRVKGRFVKRSEDLVLSGDLLASLSSRPAAAAPAPAPPAPGASVSPAGSLSPAAGDEEEEEREAEAGTERSRRMRRHSVAF